jgi:hypothetical protein
VLLFSSSSAFFQSKVNFVAFHLFPFQEVFIERRRTPMVGHLFVMLLLLLTGFAEADALAELLI